MNWTEITIEDCLYMYMKGWSAVLNNRQVRGFRSELKERKLPELTLVESA